MTFAVVTTSADDSERLAARLAALTEPPVTIGLIGSLGAGKTAFVRGFVRGVDPALADWVSSPTYAVCNEYPSVPPVLHLDLYRLADADDLEGVGYAEFDDGWRLVEWVDRVPEALASADIVVRMRRVGEESREIRIEGVSDRGRGVVQALGATWSST